MVDNMQTRGCLTNDAVRDAFLRVPRELFIPDVADKEGLEAVYRNEAHPAKVDQAGRWLSSSSEPQLMAAMLEALQLHAGHAVMEIGAGTGYNAALMASIVGAEGRVTSLDISPDLAQRAHAAAVAAGQIIKAVTADGRQGWPDDAPYDRIIVTASSPVIEPAWFEQLRVGGLLMVPLHEFVPPIGAIPVLRRVGNHLEMVAIVRGGFMPLRSDAEVFPEHRVLPAVGAFDSIGGDGPMVWLSGSGIGRLDATARRRLLAIILAAPTPRGRRTSITRESAWRPATIVPPEVFVAIAVPENRVVQLMRPDVAGVGVAARDGRSLAALCWRRPAHPRGRPDDDPSDVDVWTESYGSGEATAMIDRLLRMRRGLGPPTFADLKMRIDLDGAPARRSWRRWQRGDCWISFDWRQPAARRPESDQRLRGVPGGG